MIDIQFRSTRPGYFCSDLLYTQTFRKHNDRCSARSIDRGDWYRTCTPNLIRNDHPASHWHSIHEPLSIHHSNPGTILPTEAASTATPPTVFCLPCMPSRVCNRSARARSTPLDRVDRLNVGPTKHSDRSDRLQVGSCRDPNRSDRLS